MNGTVKFIIYLLVTFVYSSLMYDLINVINSNIKIAEKKFKKLGYIKSNLSNNDVLVYVNKYSKNHEIIVTFNLYSQEYTVEHSSFFSMSEVFEIDYRLHETITRQMIELKWI